MTEDVARICLLEIADLYDHQGEYIAISDIGSDACSDEAYGSKSLSKLKTYVKEICNDLQEGEEAEFIIFKLPKQMLHIRATCPEPRIKIETSGRA